MSTNTEVFLTLRGRENVVGEIVDFGRYGVIVRLESGKEIGVVFADFKLNTNS